MTQINVENLEAIANFRAQLVKFAEATQVALMEAESDLRRTSSWLEGEMTSHWKTQIRKRADTVEKCKAAVREKQLFKDSTGKTSSAVDEMKALKKAQVSLEEAHQKAANTQRAIRLLQREAMNFSGAINPLSGTVSSEIPAQVSRLSNLLKLLQQYMSLDSRPGGGPGFQTSGSTASSMKFTDGPIIEGEEGEIIPDTAPLLLLNCRLSTPPAGTRDRASLQDLADTAAKFSPLHDDDQKRIAAIVRSLSAADRGTSTGLAQATGVGSSSDDTTPGRLTFPAVLQAGEAMYLERVAGETEQHLDLHAGAIGRTVAGATVACDLTPLLATLGGWNEILKLPLGAMLIVEAGRITRVVDALDRELKE